MNFKEMAIDALKGFLIGVASLIPGVSSGTIALITKIYDKMVSSIANLTKRFWASAKVLIPIGIGALIAVIAMWYPLKLATEHILFAVVCLFAGCMVGSLPDIASNIKREKFKKRYVIYIILAILAGMSLGILSYHSNVDVSSLFNPIDWKLYLIIIPIGFISAAGIVVPGISGSMLLLVLGFYTNILNMFGGGKPLGPAIGAFGCMAVGIILGLIAFSLLMKFLLKRYHTATFVWLVGLIAGSIFSLFYNHDIMAYYQTKGVVWWEALLGFILFIIGIAGSYYLVIYQRKHKEAEIKAIEVKPESTDSNAPKE